MAAESTMTPASLQQILHHAKNPKGVGSDAVKEVYDNWTDTYDEVSYEYLIQCYGSVIHWCIGSNNPLWLLLILEGVEMFVAYVSFKVYLKTKIQYFKRRSS